MTRQSAFAIIYSPEVADHIDAIERKHHRLIEKTIDEQLSHRPNRQTHNRKPLEELPGPFGSTWELRFGPPNQFRVFYEIVEDERTVWVLAIGVKDGSRLFIAGEEF
ncbi:MAG: type II toxin-antitoxin system RelE/ParE family toxin [Anaerolineales bacterium]|jgi:mRNA-degrading endonuclease RelE of RelBE toxin-antitoxin system